MGKKIISAIAAVGLLAAGVYLGSELGSNNSATIVGGADRYAQKSGATSAAVGSLAKSVGASGKGQVHAVRDGESIQAAVQKAQQAT